MDEPCMKSAVTLEAGGMITPLGRGVAENYQAALRDDSCLERQEGTFGVQEPFVASLFHRATVEAAFEAIAEKRKEKDGGVADDAPYTFFEKTVIIAMHDALQQMAGDEAFDLRSDDTLFVLSSTKGNVGLMADDEADPRILLGEAAQRISRFWGITTKPVVVSNACISGVSAQILAQRLLLQGHCRYAVVAGGDEQSRFIVSGFQSFKALSPTRCRPYDAQRDGLNLGEAAAAMVLKAKAAEEVLSDDWVLRAGSVRNDANHISGPSRVGEGSFQALKRVTEGATDNELAFVNAHGTATLYNDEMESIAINRAGLSDVPVNALKGVFGHTMGAAGILETLLSAEALRHAMVLPTHGFKTLGVSQKIAVSNERMTTERAGFVKLMSGFGGCNAAVHYVKGKCLEGAPEIGPAKETKPAGTVYHLSHSLHLRSDGHVSLDGEERDCTEKGAAMLTALYRKEVNNYPKFFKMDPLCRLGFIATELLLKAEGETAEGARNDRAVVVCTHHGCYANDCRYQQTITDENYFPSPAVFVYTLANIVTGEIAIRHHYQGETSCFVVQEYEAERVRQLAATAFCDHETKSVVCAWLDCRNEGEFEAVVELMERNV